MISEYVTELLTPDRALAELRKPRGARGRKTICINVRSPAPRAIHCSGLAEDFQKPLELHGFIDLTKAQACQVIVDLYKRRYTSGGAPALVQFTWGDGILFIN